MASFRGIPPVGFVGTGGSLVQVLQKSADINRQEICADVKCVNKNEKILNSVRGGQRARTRRRLQVTGGIRYL